MDRPTISFTTTYVGLESRWGNELTRMGSHLLIPLASLYGFIYIYMYRVKLVRLASGRFGPPSATQLHAGALTVP